MRRKQRMVRDLKIADMPVLRFQCSGFSPDRILTPELSGILKSFTSLKLFEKQVIGE